MADDQNQKIIYSESKLINHIKKELDKPDTNYSTCLTYMKNLGQLSATKDKEIDDALYNSLFTCISTIFRRADNPNVVPLSLRIICLKLLTNSCIILNSHQHTNTSSVAYSLIIKEVGNEVVKPNYSVSFIITILDAIYLCSKSDCIDDKATIQALLLLSKIKNSLIPVNRESLAIALDIDLAPFNQKYKYGDKAKEMNQLLINLGCMKTISDTKTAATFVIPQPSMITTLEQRLAAQDFLKALSANEIAERVINGFGKFPKVDNYQPPESVTDLIESLIKGPEEVFDQEVSITDATIYIVEQALERLNDRTKYIPLQVQSDFIAMLIATLDSTKDGFEECSGPATTSALKCAIDPKKILVQFLVSWANYEFVRSSQKRYENLVIQIFQSIVYVESNNENNGEMTNTNNNIDENSLVDFIKNLEWLPLELYSLLTQICSQNPFQSDQILTAVNEYIMNAPASLQHFLSALLELSINPLDKINDQAIKIIKTYYERKNEQTINKINDFTIENLKKTLTEEDPEPYLKLFFAVIELNMSLFIDLMEVYAEAQNNLKTLQSTIRDKLKKQITSMPYDITVIKRALEIALGDKPKTALMHLYLSELAKKLFVPPDLVELLKKQFESSKDSRYLIPIIPNLNEEEFKLYLPDILKLGENALKRAIASLLEATKPPISPILFLIELHKPEIAGKNKEKAIMAMTICLSRSDKYNYQLVSTAVEVCQKNKYHDIIMNTLSEMVKNFSNQGCHKFILNHILPPLINNGITELDEPWQLMKKLIYDTKPTSCKTALTSFTADQIKDLIATYPDYKSLLQGQAKKISRINPAVLEAIQ